MSTVSSTGNTPNSQEVLAGLARKAESTSSTAIEETQTRFLKLLTTQLQNQDPMNPMENAELTSQLAQMSTVEGIEKLNAMMTKLVEAQESAESLQAAALVGRGVLVEGKNLTLTEGGAVGGFELTGPADSVQLSIRDSSGVEVASVEMNGLQEGSHNYVWDGTATNGTRAADGMYTVHVSGTQGGESIIVTPLQFGAVSGVMRGAAGTDLQVGALGIFKMSDIKQIL